MKIKEIYNKHKKIIYWCIFILYAIINLVLTLLHEPWRDEIHTWLLSKELTIPEIFIESRFDGHPILWHLLLMPFAKNGFPILTLNIISYVIMLIATWIFLFKTKVPDIIKIFSVFTIPFTYTFSAISRNYALLVLFLMIIGVLYKDRYKYPLIYSVLICFLIHTHALAWGIVAGLTLTFHIYEILLALRKKNNLELKNAIIGLLLIASNTIFVVLQLYGTSNENYSTASINNVKKPVAIALIFLVLFIFYTIIVLRRNYKEGIILTLGVGFQLYIYAYVYSAITFQRQILFYTLILFYLILIQNEKKTDWKTIGLYISFLVITICYGMPIFLDFTKNDINRPFSGAKDMATYINENVPKNSTILVDTMVITQSLIPYLDEGYTLYDVGYEKSSKTSQSMSDNNQLKIKALKKITEKYKDKYLVVSNGIVKYFDLKEVHSSGSVEAEFYTLYKIP